VSDIDTGGVDSLKALDPDGRLEKRTKAGLKCRSATMADGFSVDPNLGEIGRRAYAVLEFYPDQLEAFGGCKRLLKFSWERGGDRSDPRNGSGQRPRPCINGNLLADLQLVPPPDRNPRDDESVIAHQFQQGIAGAHHSTTIGQDGTDGTRDRCAQPSLVERVEKIRQRKIGLFGGDR
jgi:hypothetical protein